MNFFTVSIIFIIYLLVLMAYEKTKSLKLRDNAISNKCLIFMTNFTNFTKCLQVNRVVYWCLLNHWINNSFKFKKNDDWYSWEKW